MAMRLCVLAAIIKVRILKSTASTAIDGSTYHVVGIRVIRYCLSPCVVARRLKASAEIVPVLNDQRIVKGVQAGSYHIDIAKITGVIWPRCVIRGVARPTPGWPARLIGGQVEVGFLRSLPALRSRVRQDEHIMGCHLSLNIQEHALIV